MKDHQTSHNLHANLAGTDTRDCHLEQPLQGIYFNEKIDEIFKALPNVFGIAETFWF